MRARRRAALLAVLVAALAAGPAQALTWSGREAIDVAAPFGTHPVIQSVSCASSSLCFAVDSTGSLLRTRHPARANSWVGVRDVDPGRSLVAVSCPSARLCVAVDTEGHVAASSRPSGTAQTWSVRKIIGIRHFSSVSCPATNLCVGADQAGRLATATRPVRGPWKVVRIIPLGTEDSIASIDCPSRMFCAARDAFGDYVLVSRSPAGGARAWRRIPVSGPRAGGGGGPISCPTTSFCAILGGSSFDGTGFAITTTHPLQAKSWKLRSIGFKDPQSLACASSSLCVGGDGTGGVLVATRPRGGALRWRRVQLGGAQTQMHAAECTRARVCVVGDGDGQLFGATRPAATADRWATSRNSLNQIPAVSCPSADLCLAGDTAGRLLSTSAPAAGGWQAQQLIPSGGLTSLSCPATAFCAAGDSTGHVRTSTAPTGGAAGWTDAAVADSNNPVVSVSCPSTSLCAAGLRSGLTASATPGGDASTWHRSNGAFGDDGDAHVSCPAGDLCLAAVYAVETDASAEFPAVEQSTNPAAAADDAWTGCAPFEQGCPVKPGIFMGASCPTTTFCAVIDRRGNVFTTDFAKHWTVANIDAGGRIPTAISCPTAGFCAVVDAQGGVITSTNPAGPASAWTRQANVDRGLAAISCASADLCVATDDRGGAVTGTT